MEGLDVQVFVAVVLCGYVTAEIRDSVILNKLIKVKPVGGPLNIKFFPLTEIPPPHKPHVSGGRRHMEADDCAKPYKGEDVFEGKRVEIEGEDYMEGVGKTVATVIIPDHIDRKHFEVTSQVPYLTLGPIEAIGHHPTTQHGDHPPECEKIYQDHLDDQYSAEDTDYSEESLEMARMPLFPRNLPSHSAEARLEHMYSDFEN